MLVSQVTQHVYVVEPFNKMRTLFDIVRKNAGDGKLLIFAGTKREVDSLTRSLQQVCVFACV
jgi:superfamily II DNA/RNA helicase